jgi:phosphoglycolate phosphatase
MNTTDNSESTRRAIVFDLDGTLLDSGRDIADSLNVTLRKFGLAEHGEAAVRGMIGEGATVLIDRALPKAINETVRQEIFAAFRVIYRESAHAHSKPYPGIVRLLHELHARGHTLAILSNKPDDVLQRLVPTALPMQLFAAAYGERPHVPRKPDPTGLHSLLRELGHSHEECIYVGDTPVDVNVSRNANCRFVGVSWGFRSKEVLERAGAEKVVDTAEQLERELA